MSRHAASCRVTESAPRLRAVSVVVGADHDEARLLARQSGVVCLRLADPTTAPVSRPRPGCRRR
ncbi:hypothetical protein [Streptomyces sp. NPDC005760]|uniref:hypothetical protein n=1 Tax=Streptomyces sp. NPDC005760 TaxID=3156718 RepID=UPI0033C5A265